MLATNCRSTALEHLQICFIHDLHAEKFYDSIYKWYNGLNSNCYLGFFFFSFLIFFLFNLNREFNGFFIHKLSFFSAEKKPQNLPLPTPNFAQLFRGHKLFLRRQKGKDSFRRYLERSLTVNAPPSSLVFSRCVTKGVQLSCWTCHAVI